MLVFRLAGRFRVARTWFVHGLSHDFHGALAIEYVFADGFGYTFAPAFSFSFGLFIFWELGIRIRAGYVYIAFHA